jgi:hypothetical protein
MRALFALALGLVGSGLGACAVASGEVSGGEARVDAAAPPSGPRDSGGGGGATFTDIYNDLLGPQGAATCTKGGDCHGGASESGAQASGYICKADKAQCRSTLLSSGLLAQGEKDFTKSGLYGVLRKDVAGARTGTMPKVPGDFVFTAAELDRIGKWVAAGTPDD